MHICFLHNGVYNSNGLRTKLIELTARVSDTILIYVGGAGVNRMRKMPKQIFIKRKLRNVSEIDF